MNDPIDTTATEAAPATNLPPVEPAGAPQAPVRRGPGRPSKFTPEVREKVLQALRGGNYRQVACDFAGISHMTLRNWLKLAEEPGADPEYVVFAEAVTKAEADAEVANLALIRRAANDGAWQAAAWQLERKNPARWGRRDATKVEVTGADGGPVDVRHTVGADVLSIETLAARLAARAVHADGVVEDPELGWGERIEPGSLGIGDGA